MDFFGDPVRDIQRSNILGLCCISIVIASVGASKSDGAGHQLFPCTCPCYAFRLPYTSQWVIRSLCTEGWWIESTSWRGLRDTQGVRSQHFLRKAEATKGINPTTTMEKTWHHRPSTRTSSTLQCQFCWGLARALS